MKKVLLIATLALSVNLSAQEPPWFIVGLDYEVYGEAGEEIYLVKGEDLFNQTTILHNRVIRSTSLWRFRRSGFQQTVRKYEGFYIYTTEWCGQVESFIVKKRRSLM